MGTLETKTRKFAIIINGDTESRHLKNVDLSAKVLKDQGYETFVANPFATLTAVDQYVEATAENIQKLIDSVKGQIQPGDELVIYTTGHGNKTEGKSSFCLADQCDFNSLITQLDELPYGQRTVIMDQCLSGNLNKLFTDNPKTLFITPGSQDELVCCDEFAPKFWGDHIPDLNHDGIISWEERYANVISGGIHFSVPQFVSTEGYLEAGTPPFANKVEDVQDSSDLDRALKQLKPGQYAIVTFSASWCGPCKEYKPKFNAMAQEGGGQHLWLRTENEELAQKYLTPGFPTVLIFDSTGQKYRVPSAEREHLFKELAQFQLPPEQLKAIRIERINQGIWKTLRAIEATDNNEKKTQLLNQAIQAIVIQDLKEEALPLYEKLFVEEMRIYYDASSMLLLAEGLSTAGTSDQTRRLFEALCNSAMALESVTSQISTTSEIALNASKAGMKDWAKAKLEVTLTASQQLEDLDQRALFLSHTALCFQKAGYVDRATHIFQQAEKAAAQIQEQDSRIKVEEYLAEVFLNAGWNKKGAFYFSKAIEEARKIRDEESRYDTLHTLTQKIEVSTLSAKEKEARWLALAKGAKSLKEPKEKVHLLADIAGRLVETGNKKEALRLSDNAIQIVASNNFPPEDVANFLGSRAKNLADNKLDQKAENLLTRAIKQWALIEDFVIRAKTLPSIEKGLNALSHVAPKRTAPLEKQLIESTDNVADDKARGYFLNAIGAELMIEGPTLPQASLGPLIDVLVQRGESLKDAGKKVVLYSGIAASYDSDLKKGEELLQKSIAVIEQVPEDAEKLSLLYTLADIIADSPQKNWILKLNSKAIEINSRRESPYGRMLVWMTLAKYLVAFGFPQEAAESVKKACQEANGDQDSLSRISARLKAESGSFKNLTFPLYDQLLETASLVWDQGWRAHLFEDIESDMIDISQSLPEKNLEEVRKSLMSLEHAIYQLTDLQVRLRTLRNMAQYMYRAGFDTISAVAMRGAILTVKELKTDEEKWDALDPLIDIISQTQNDGETMVLYKQWMDAVAEIKDAKTRQVLYDGLAHHFGSLGLNNEVKTPQN